MDSERIAWKRNGLEIHGRRRPDDVRIWGRGVPVSGDSMDMNLATALIRQALCSWCIELPITATRSLRLTVLASSGAADSVNDR